MAANNLIKSNWSGINRPKVKLDEQKVVVNQFINSGLSQKEFCVLHNLNKSTFKNWVFRHKTGSQAQTNAPVFVPISLDIDKKDSVDNQDFRSVEFANPNIIAQPDLLKSTNVSAVSATFKFEVQHGVNFH